MRLTAQQIQTLRQKSAQHFGENTHLWLFGSRTDDSKKGGDIDLLIEPGLHDPAAIIDAKLAACRT